MNLAKSQDLQPCLLLPRLSFQELCCGTRLVWVQTWLVGLMLQSYLDHA